MNKPETTTKTPTSNNNSNRNNKNLEIVSENLYIYIYIILPYTPKGTSQIPIQTETSLLQNVKQIHKLSAQ